MNPIHSGERDETNKAYALSLSNRDFRDATGPDFLGCVGESGWLNYPKLTAIRDLLQPRRIVHDMKENLQGGVFYASDAPHLARGRLAAISESAVCTAMLKLDDPAFIQLTSSSTSAPKAVPLTHEQVIASVSALNERAHATAEDHEISWQPLFRDMGLSALTHPLEADAALTLIPTECFVRSLKVGYRR